MAPPELDKLLVDHLSDIDAATKQLDDLQHRVFQAIDGLIHDWADAEGWAGKFDYIGKELWLAPESWRTPGSALEKNSFDAWFEMDVGEGDTQSQSLDEDYFYLTRLCGQGSGMILLRFRQRITGRLRWRKSFGVNSELLSTTGFLTDGEPSFFLPVRIDSTTLARALLESDIQGALSPVSATLEHLKASKSVFDAIIDAFKATEN